jgi:membrane protein required for colicin V production
MEALTVLTGWDWFIAGVLVLSIAFGLVRGFVTTVFALAAWVVALIGTPIAGWYAMPYLHAAVPDWVVYVGAFILLFVSVRLAGGLLARGLRGVGLGGLDRVLGGAIGVARAALVVMLAAVGGHLAGMSHEPSWQRSVSRPLLDGLVHWMEPYLPDATRGIRRTQAVTHQRESG